MLAYQIVKYNGIQQHSLYATYPSLIFAILSTLQGPSLAQNSPQDYLDAHNAARLQVGVGPMTWDNNVENFAINHVKEMLVDCIFAHSVNRTYGENIASSGGGLTGQDAVNMWVGEKNNYDYISNSCVGGDCQHYTQVVWSNSVRLGCARAQCSDGTWFVSCSYDPPGNVVGEQPY